MGLIQIRLMKNVHVKYYIQINFLMKPEDIVLYIKENLLNKNVYVKRYNQMKNVVFLINVLKKFIMKLIINYTVKHIKGI